MRRFATIVMLLFLCVNVFGQSEWISFNKGNSQPQSPEVQIILNSNESTVLEITVPGVLRDEILTLNGKFQSIAFVDGSKMNNVGAPAVPYLSEILAIPNDASISYEVLEVDEYEILSNVMLPPARESWFEGSMEPEYQMDEMVYKSAATFPKDLVNLSDPFIFRDFRLTRVSIFPAQYDSEKNELKIAKRMKVKITYGANQSKNVKTTPIKKIAPSFASIYRNTILNYEQVLNERYNGKEDGREVLLMIIPDDFYEHFEEYIQWKKKTGFEVIAVKFSEIGANSTNPIIIRDYISDLYLTLENPPTYVSIVGDADEFPYKIAVYSDYSFPDEDYFVKVDGDDFIPDMFIGRISVQTENTLDVILHKLLKYESTPFIDGSNWFEKGICCSNNYYESQITTKEYTANIMRVDGGFESVDEFMSDADWQSACTYTMEDVLNSLNEGRSFLNYRGEGWSSGWWATCTPFTLSELDYLQNGEKFTFVTSIGCGVAMFNASGGNSFGERWLKMGTISNPRGAVNFVGPTSNTHTTYNNFLDKGLYVGMFKEDLYTPGQALLRGKLHVLDQFGTTDFNTEYQFRVYCNLGDPSTRIWKESPKQATVTYPSIINTETTSFSVYVGDISIGSRVINVNILGADFSLNKLVDETGTATFIFTPTELDTLDITVTGVGVKPFYGKIIVEDGSGVNDITGAEQIVKGVPNPFADYTEIQYHVAEAAESVVAIYDISGKLVKQLEKQYKSVGDYVIRWDGDDDSGNAVSAGVYFLTVQTGREMQTIRLLKMN